MYQHTSYKGPQNWLKIIVISCITLAALYAVMKAEFFPVMLYLIGAITFASFVAWVLFYIISRIENHKSRFGRR